MKIELVKERTGRYRLVRLATVEDELRGHRPSASEGGLGGIAKGRAPFHRELIRDDAFEFYSRLRQLKPWVEGELAGDWTLERAAALVCLEPKYFSCFFHRKVGVRFQDWLAWIRVQRAMELLRASDEPITEVAARVGYQELRGLERAFRRLVGTSPIAYRRQQGGT